jgi:hypothetical protein
MLKITHGVNAGFYSNCTVRLSAIIKYFNENKKLPELVDCSEMFYFYKSPSNLHDDISGEYFKKNDSFVLNYDHEIKIRNDDIEDQFSDYNTLLYDDISFFVKTYFSLTQNIKDIVELLEKKYTIDYENTCVLFYRGNDKCVETNICSYEEIIEKGKNVQRKNPNVKFLIQSDETDFIEKMSNEFSNSFYFNEEIRHIPKISSVFHGYMVDCEKNEDNFHYSKYFLAIVFIMSKCKNIICTSGNISMWISLFRGNAYGIYQYLNPIEYSYGLKNKNYDPDQTEFWIETNAPC